jgi:hypothetical protein
MTPSEDGYIKSLRTVQRNAPSGYHFTFRKFPCHNSTIMAFTLTKIQPDSSAQLLFAPTANNTFSDNHSPKTAEPSPSLNPHSVVSHFLQLKRHPSLPPRPPTVVPTSAIERIDNHSQCLNDFDTAFSGLLPITGEMKSSDRESLICASVKGTLLLSPYSLSIFSLYKIRLQRLQTL